MKAGAGKYSYVWGCDNVGLSNLIGRYEQVSTYISWLFDRLN